MAKIHHQAWPTKTYHSMKHILPHLFPKQFQDIQMVGKKSCNLTNWHIYPPLHHPLQLLQNNSRSLPSTQNASSNILNIVLIMNTLSSFDSPKKIVSSTYCSMLMTHPPPSYNPSTNTWFWLLALNYSNLRLPLGRGKEPKDLFDEGPCST